MERQTTLRYNIRENRYVKVNNQKIITYELAINVHLNRWYATAVSPCDKLRLKDHSVNVKQPLFRYYVIRSNSTTIRRFATEIKYYNKVLELSGMIFNCKVFKFTTFASHIIYNYNCLRL